MQYQPQCKLHRQVPLPFAGSSCAAPLPQRAQTPRALAAQRPPHNWHAVEQPWLAARNGAHPHAPPLLLQPHQGWLAAGESSCCRHCRRRRHCRWLLQAAPPPALADAAAVAALGQAQRCRRAACPCAGAGAGAKGRIRSVRLCAGRYSRSDWVDTMLTCGASLGVILARGAQQVHSSLLDAVCRLPASSGNCFGPAIGEQPTFSGTQGGSCAPSRGRQALLDLSILYNAEHAYRTDAACARPSRTRPTPATLPPPPPPPLLGALLASRASCLCLPSKAIFQTNPKRNACYSPAPCALQGVPRVAACVARQPWSS